MKKETQHENANENDIKSIQIIKIEGTKFTFDYDAFKRIVEKNVYCKDLPVAVIIINGALRTGKSFFSNFIIRQLLNEDQDEILTDYFISRRGYDVETLGVWALDRIFIHDGKAIVLMDTQGIFDQELNQAMTIALISLSTIVSSYQIYNLDKRIQEDHLCNMAYFSAYSTLITNTDNSKIGQTLCLLVRDWPNFDNNYDLVRCDNETQIYRREFLENKNMSDPVKIETRKKIYDTYDNVVVRLCPHPGYIVTEGKFSDRLSEVRKDFIIHVQHIIQKILLDIEPKRIGGNQILLCRELPEYLKGYIKLYENVKESLPEAMTILETTEKICQDNSVTKTLHFYKEMMISRIKTRHMIKEDIEAWHQCCYRDATKFFNKLYIMGDDVDIKNVRQHINDEIQKEYFYFLLMASEKNIVNIYCLKIFEKILELGKRVSKKLNIKFNLLSELFLRNFSIILAISYIFSLFIPYPYGSELLCSLIKYAMFILLGIYICLYIEKDNVLLEETQKNTLCDDFGLSFDTE